MSVRVIGCIKSLWVYLSCNRFIIKFDVYKFVFVKCGVLVWDLILIELI